MGREIRRVALDFDWPQGKVWHGFLNPLHAAEKCTACDGTGYSPEAKRMHKRWYGNAPFRPEDRGSTPFMPTDFVVRSFAERNVERSPGFYGAPWGAFGGRDGAIEREARRLCAHFNGSWCHHLNQDDVDALVEGGRLYDFTHEYIPGEGWKEKIPAYHPTAAEVNEWSINGLGHDSINCWIVLKAECARMGVPYSCASCDGEGELWPSEDAKAAYEAWEETPPAVGEGWQMWETVSEGSPVTPVFPTADELVWHLVIHEGYTETAARRFVDSGWAPSLIAGDFGVMSGIAALDHMGDDA